MLEHLGLNLRTPRLLCLHLLPRAYTLCGRVGCEGCVLPELLQRFGLEQAAVAASSASKEHSAEHAATLQSSGIDTLLPGLHWPL